MARHNTDVHSKVSLPSKQSSAVTENMARHNTDVHSKVSLPSKQSSTLAENKSPAVKSCVRSLLEFLFTQVGVGGLVVCYTICGALAFQAIETTDETDDLIEQVATRRAGAVSELWNITNTFNTLNTRQWRNRTMLVISSYQEDMIHLLHQGYDGHTVHQRWAFPAALMFTLSVITTIGYGNIVPRTHYGKIATMLYAVLGIPVYILYFRNMGKVFARVLKWIYHKIYFWTVRRRNDNQYKAIIKEVEDQDFLHISEEVLVPSTACVLVMVVYLVIGTIMFALWEDWNYLDSAYFCVTSLLKIGFGDFVPGTSSYGETNHAKLYIDYFYLLFGMGVVAMNYYLLKEEVMMRVNQMRRKIRETSAKIGFSCNRNKQ